MGLYVLKQKTIHNVFVNENLFIEFCELYNSIMEKHVEIYLYIKIYLCISMTWAREDTNSNNGCTGDKYGIGGLE